MPKNNIYIKKKSWCCSEGISAYNKRYLIQLLYKSNYLQAQILWVKQKNIYRIQKARS